MTSISTDSLLKGIGCNMVGSLPRQFFPEECLIELSNRALSDFKTVSLLLGALKTHADLIHPEILLKFLQRCNKSAQTNVLGALIFKLDDRRFQKIINYCKDQKHIHKNENPAKELVLAAKIGQSKYDSHFSKFGIEISELPLPDPKKISSLERLTKSNTYFKNRILFGCNWRADVISCIQLGSTNPSQVKDRLHCSYETAHRIFNDYSVFKSVFSDRIESELVSAGGSNA